MTQDAAKQAAAIAAAALVEPGMRFGLGSGSTIELLIAELGRRVREEGLHATAVPTSERTARGAAEAGLALALPGPPLDLAIDGTDELVRGSFQLIKGLGGALLREKIVAQLARRFVIVADASKLVPVLGARAALPLEVTPFGLAATTRRVTEAGGRPTVRLGAGGAPFVTDGGNHVLDCPGFAPISAPEALEQRLRGIAGVLETGLFLGLATEALIAHPEGRLEHLVR